MLKVDRKHDANPLMSTNLLSLRFNNWTRCILCQSSTHATTNVRKCTCDSQNAISTFERPEVFAKKRFSRICWANINGVCVFCALKWSISQVCKLLKNTQRLWRDPYLMHGCICALLNETLTSKSVQWNTNRKQAQRREGTANPRRTVKHRWYHVCWHCRTEVNLDRNQKNTMKSWIRISVKIWAQ